MERLGTRFDVPGAQHGLIGSYAMQHHALATIAAGESVIKRPSPLNVLKDTCDHSWY